MHIPRGEWHDVSQASSRITSPVEVDAGRLCPSPLLPRSASGRRTCRTVDPAPSPSRAPFHRLRRSILQSRTSRAQKVVWQPACVGRLEVAHGLAFSSELVLPSAVAQRNPSVASIPPHSSRLGVNPFLCMTLMCDSDDLFPAACARRLVSLGRGADRLPTLRRSRYSTERPPSPR